MPCLGNAKDHCCYIKGAPCPYVIQDYTDEIVSRTFNASVESVCVRGIS